VKKLLTIGLIALLGFSSCGSSPKAGADQLDVAIREASDYLNSNVTRGNKLAILNIQSSYPALSEYIIDELIANTVNDRIFSVVDRQQLDTIRAEQNFQMSGEVDDSSAQELGRMLGAQTIITGIVSKVGDNYRLRVRALSVQSAQIEGQFNKNIANSPTLNTLVQSSPAGSQTATTVQTRPATTTQPASSAAPAVNQSSATPIRLGTWKLSGLDSQNTIWAADLVIQAFRNNAFAGYFDWKSGFYETFRGREYFEGTYNPQNQTVLFRGTRLERATNLALGSYQARVTGGGIKLDNGTWGSSGGVVPGSWEAEWLRE
jgi:TolB-like protein